ncbi:hypothetical protein K1719_041166 [Acacia pycnantha]|nr:hypothetical protein K1719_041166 [Acacia pycnantha]
MSSSMVPVPMQSVTFAEEFDLLQRSSKKIKNGDLLNDEGEWPVLAKTTQKKWGCGQSFAEKLKGSCNEETMVGSAEGVHSLSDDPILDSETEMEGSEPEDDENRKVSSEQVVQSLTVVGEKSQAGNLEKGGSTESRLRVRKNGGKRKGERKMRSAVEGRTQDLVRQDLKREKRFEDYLGGELQSGVSMGLSKEISSSEVLQKGRVQSLDDSGGMGVDDVASSPILFAAEMLDPGDSEMVPSLHGKFWAAPNESGPVVGVDSLDPGIHGPDPDLVGAGGEDAGLSVMTESVDRLRCVSRLGFDGLSYVPSVGRSGGILAAWNSAFVEVEVLRLDRRFIHLGCGILMRIGYASLRSWSVIGDFNDIATLDERTGGSSGCSLRCSLFTDRLQACNLMDDRSLGWAGGGGSKTGQGVGFRGDTLGAVFAIGVEGRFSRSAIQERDVRL